MDTVKQSLSGLNNGLNNVLSNTYVSIIIQLFIVLYASYVAPNPPTFVKSILDNTFGKMIVIALIIFMSNNNIGTALVMAIVFVLVINAISGRPLLESYSSISDAFVKDLQSSIKLLEPKTMLHFGCLKMTAASLLEAFNGDKTDLQRTVLHSFQELMAKSKSVPAQERLLAIARKVGLPYDMDLNDENAPYIATILVNWGYDFGGKCKNE